MMKIYPKKKTSNLKHLFELFPWDDHCDFTKTKIYPETKEKTADE